MQENMSKTEEEVKKLLQTHGDVIEKLVNLCVVKTRNNPIGDYTEWLVRRRMGLKEAPSNQKGFDAVDDNGNRYQIKGRREEGTSVQFSPIRATLNSCHFDFLIAVAFNNDYSKNLRFAVKIPHGIVEKFNKASARHVNGHLPILRDEHAKQPGVTDIRRLSSTEEFNEPYQPSEANPCILPIPAKLLKWAIPAL